MKNLIAFFLLGGAIARADAPETLPEDPPDPIQQIVEYKQDLRPLPLTDRERWCLAKNLWHEARNEPAEGKIAVLLVTTNRAVSGRHPRDICAVVYERSKNKQGKLVCQFSWTCERLPKPREDSPRWLQVEQLIENYQQGQYKYYQQKYQNVYNYHATYVRPNWANLKRYRQVGLHIFYKPH